MKQNALHRCKSFIPRIQTALTSSGRTVSISRRIHAVLSGGMLGKLDGCKVANNSGTAFGQ
jgi:hypothetical protein